MVDKHRIDVDIFWDFGSCPAPTDASGYAVASHIRTLALRLGIVKSFKTYLSISDHHTSARALTLRSELQSSGVSLTDAPGAKEIANQMLTVDMLAHAFDSNPESDTNIIVLIAGDPSFSYLLSILRMRNYKVVVLGPGGGPEDYSNNSASLASQANLWLDWNTEVMDDIIPRSTSAGVSSVSRTTENVNSTSDSTKFESPSDSREKPVSTTAEVTSVRVQANEDYKAKMDSTTEQQPTARSTLQEPVRSKSFTRLSGDNNASNPSTALPATVTEGEDNPILQSTLQEPAKSKSFTRLSWKDIASKALPATATEGEDQPVPQSTLQEPAKPSFTRLSWDDIASKSSTALSSTVTEGEDQPIPQSTLQEPVKLKSFTRLSWSDIASKPSTALSATVTKGEDLPQDSTINSKPTTTSDKGETQNLPKPQPQPAATVRHTSSDSRTQSSQPRDSKSPSDLAPESTPLSTWGDWPSSQAASAPSPWNNNPYGNPPEYSLNASGSTSNKAASSTSTEAVVPPEFANLVKVLRLSTANGVRKPLWGVIAFELIKQDPRVYEKAGPGRTRTFSVYHSTMAHKPRGDVDIFWDFGSCPAPTDASGYTVASQIRTLALRLGIVKSFKAYLSISDHHTNGRALTLRSELQSSGVSLTDAPGAKEIADKMLIVDILAHAFDSNPESDGSIIMLIAGDPSFSYLLSILRMRNYRVVVLGPGGGPEDYSNNSASLASQANLWLDWNTEVLDGIIPRSTSTRVSSASRTTENLNSTSDSTKSESPSDSREKLVSAIAEATSMRAQAEKEQKAKMDSTTDQQPIPQSTLQAPLKSPSLSRSEIAPRPSTLLSATATEDVPQNPSVNSKPTTTSDKGEKQNLQKPQPQPAATVWYTPFDSRTQSSQPRDSNNPFDWGGAPASTWGDWPSSQAAPAPSPWSNNPYGNPPEYSPNASGWTSNKATSSTSTAAVVPPEFANLVKVLRLSTANGIRKPLWGVIAFELIKQDPRVYEKAGGVEWVSLHRNFC
ncbi:hypothetical protein H1R20_g7007, partial [Candolleomyces eurysporus]